MIKFFKWLFWRSFYLCVPSPRNFDKYMRRAIRCRWPWAVFQPSLYHCDVLKEWQVYFGGDRSYTTDITVTLDVHVSLEDGRIVGLEIPDELLEAGVGNGRLFRERYR